ncbi:foldase protein PrsA [Gracilibacillus xinjiangensis]|uniref:peptidylprolyl isomerase n=1 Tax=Gracilibacillus xinjiangensis TaxID=1193282 RepID=A0ABV8WVI1_9BACI
MNLSKLSLWIIILLLLITNIFTLFFHKDNGNEVERIVFKETSGPLATVNGKEISREDVLQRLMNDYGTSTLINLINEEVVFSLAEKNSLVIEDKIVDRELSNLLVMQGLLEEDEKSELLDGWERGIKYRYFLQQLLTKDIQIDDKEIEQYYNNYKNQYNFEQRVQLSHIVVPSIEIAEKVFDELESGKSFASAAQQYSIDDSGANGGYLGFYSKTSSFIPEEYFEQAIQLERDSYSDAIETNQGIAIIYVHENLPAITLTLEEVYHEVKQDLALERLEQDVNAANLWDQLEVETVIDDD